MHLIVKQTMLPILQKTKDGSHTLFVESMNETYHSTHGAIQEAKHVFLKNGIESIEKSNISVLEIGFGTGLNALLTFQYAQENKKNIHYYTLETFPLDKEITENLNYISELEKKELKSTFEKLHHSNWEENCTISDNFTLYKTNQKIQDYETNQKFDVIYYDAFGPPTQPEMWTPEIFKKLYNLLNTNGFLVTYCAKGQVKRDLKSVGFEVISLPGPPGKREMTKAIKQM